ncbi:unnamed protein product [Dicrocoelium dendriticum]|nr:unnamed protein product [Dicrocoelium dendriticum]
MPLLRALSVPLPNSLPPLPSPPLPPLPSLTSISILLHPAYHLTPLPITSSLPRPHPRPSITYHSHIHLPSISLPNSYPDLSPPSPPAPSTIPSLLLSPPSLLHPSLSPPHSLLLLNPYPPSLPPSLSSYLPASLSHTHRTALPQHPPLQSPAPPPHLSPPHTSPSTSHPSPGVLIPLTNLLYLHTLLPLVTYAPHCSVISSSSPLPLTSPPSLRFTPSSSHSTLNPSVLSDTHILHLRDLAHATHLPPHRPRCSRYTLSLPSPPFPTHPLPLPLTTILPTTLRLLIFTPAYPPLLLSSPIRHDHLTHYPSYHPLPPLRLITSLYAPTILLLLRSQSPAPSPYSMAHYASRRKGPPPPPYLSYIPSYPLSYQPYHLHPHIFPLPTPTCSRSHLLPYTPLTRSCLLLALTPPLPFYVVPLPPPLPLILPALLHSPFSSAFLRASACSPLPRSPNCLSIPSPTPPPLPSSTPLHLSTPYTLSPYPPRPLPQSSAQLVRVTLPQPTDALAYTHPSSPASPALNRPRPPHTLSSPLSLALLYPPRPASNPPITQPYPSIANLLNPSPPSPSRHLTPFVLLLDLLQLPHYLQTSPPPFRPRLTSIPTHCTLNPRSTSSHLPPTHPHRPPLPALPLQTYLPPPHTSLPPLSFRHPSLPLATDPYSAALSPPVPSRSTSPLYSLTHPLSPPPSPLTAAPFYPSRPPPHSPSAYPRLTPPASSSHAPPTRLPILHILLLRLL